MTDKQFTIRLTHDMDGNEAEPGVLPDDASHIIQNVEPARRGEVTFTIDGPVTVRGPAEVIGLLWYVLGEVPDLRVLTEVTATLAIPSVNDWQEADRIAAELTERIMRGMDCVNPSKFEQHVKATLTAYFAMEAAKERVYADVITETYGVRPHLPMSPEEADRKRRSEELYESHIQSEADTFHTHFRKDCSPSYCGRPVLPRP